MTDFRRPIPNRQNELLRKNLSAPAYDLESLSEKSEKGSSLAKEPSTLETNEFPIKGLAPDNKPPGLQKSKVNRANVTRRDDDTTKDITIGIQDHDEAIMYYFNNVIKPFVIQNNERIAVPVIYGSPERWKSMQADGFYRDKNGKTMVPLVMFKRSSFEKDNTIGNKLDGNKVHNVEYFETRYSRRNNYDNFSVLQNQLPQREYILGVIPDYLTINYEMSIFTDFTEQMNEITEAIEFSARSYWGDPEKFMFRADIKTFNTPTLLESGVDRLTKKLIIQ